MVNVGRVGGGEAINARARSAWCEVDVRSADADVLAQLEVEVVSAVRAAVPGVTVELHEFGRRPAGAVADDHPLVEAAVQALHRAGWQAELGAASTDANAAYAVGIPAVSVGVTTGSGEHTLGEWIDVEPIEEGVKVLADTIVELSTVRT
jgi:acetylornithine deacetylase/succinyl-diaminopimelate desuccinylase-like protein